MTKVFISYSRKDKVFEGRLTQALEKSDLETWIDWEDIPPTADWMDQIHKGIEQADGFLFLLSPDSVASKVCGQEVDYAVQNGKRLIPIVARDINSNDVHPALGKVNWIYCREGDDFDGAVNKTLSAIRTDLAWVEAHKRMQVRALEWDKRRDVSLLLRGKDLREAEEQLASAGQKDPQPTDLQRQYVLESRRGESRTRNLALIIGAVVIAALLLLSIFAVNQKNIASDNALTAVANQYAAQTAQANAESERKVALSNGLSSNALLLQERSEISLAFLLSVQANDFAETARSKNALYTLLRQNEYMIAAMKLPDNLLLETFPKYMVNASGTKLITDFHDISEFGSPDAQFFLWDLTTFQELDEKVFPKDTPVSIDAKSNQILPNESGELLDGFLMGDYESPNYLGSLQNKLWDLWLLPDSAISLGTYCKFIKTMSSRCSEPTVFVFKNDRSFFEPKVVQIAETTTSLLKVAYNNENQLIVLAYAGDGNMQIWRVQNNDLVFSDEFNVPKFVSLKESKGFEFIPDLNLIAWGTNDNKIIVWDTQTKSLSTQYDFDFPVSDFKISPDGTKMAVRGASGIKFFLRTNGEIQPFDLEARPEYIGAMGLSGNGDVFVTGYGTRLQVFDTRTAQQVNVIDITSTGDSEIKNIFVSNDGAAIAVGMSPTSAGPIERSYLIDIQTGLETGPFDEVLAPILSPDNNQLTSMNYSSNMSLSIWDMEIENWKARACQIANRNLTKEEWGQYMGNEPYQPTCPNYPAPGQP